jgi:hypothetical protein
MQFPRTSAVCLIMVAASSCIAIAHVRAQIVTVQPFVGIQVAEASPREGDLPIPRTYLQTIAVRSDGSIATVSKWDRSAGGPRYPRDVIDATAKHHISVDPVTQSILFRAYNDVQTIGRYSCEGSSVGQMEGFDVVFLESTETLKDGSSITEKEWKAPKLGCYSLALELTETRRNGEVIGNTKQSLVHIKLGEPDPWYFAIPTNYTTRTPDEWRVLMSGLLQK